MEADLHEIEHRLAASELAAFARAEVPLPADAGSTLVIEIDDADLLSVWRLAREAMAGLDLHPVAVATWGVQDWTRASLFSRFPYGGGDTAPRAVVERSLELTVADAIARFCSDAQWAIENWASTVDWQLGLTEGLVGSAPDPLVWASVPVGDNIELERRLLAWEEDLRPSDPQATNESFGWFEPRPNDRVGLVLLPVTAACNASAFLPFYGAEGAGRPEALIRLMREWQGRFRAELVASWGTMLQFVVAAPPATLAAAFELAAQQDLVAPCTTALPGESIRQLARHLWRGERWFLHERP